MAHTTTAAAVTLALSSVMLGGPATAAPTAAVTAGAPASQSRAHDRVGPDRGDLLAQPRHGERAVNALAGDLDVAAARSAMRPAELRSLLRTDTTAWVGPDGRVFYIDPPATGAARAPAAAAPHPYGDTFLLHSRPGASRVVYLDFDGGAVSGTVWNDDFGVVTTPQPAYDTDGSSATFGTAERDAVQSVWQRVSEDFAPFDVDVTTQDPGAAALARTGPDDEAYGTRALVTPSVEAQSKICPGGCGGVATVSTYNRVGSAYASPAWIFAHKLGNGTKAIAEAATHEVGHNLGLRHDGSSSDGYYDGHGSWAPIMGVGYSRPITQWSRGEYTDANNLEDDLSVIQAHGLALPPDDHGDTAQTATPLAGDGVTADALIGLRTDVDVFRLSRTCTGPLTADALPAPTSPDLDIGLRLLSDTGAPIATSNPASGTLSTDRASGLAAGVSVTTEPGSYYLEVDGVGAGQPASTGYSDYASLGRYSLRVSGCNGAAPAGRPGAPRVGVASPGVTTDARITATARWRPPSTDGGSVVTGYRVTALRLDGDGAVVGSTVSAVQLADVRTLTMELPRRSRYSFTVRAINAIGQSRPSARSAPVAGR